MIARTVRNPHAGQPFTTSDDAIADALADVSIPTLMLSLVHMAGWTTLSPWRLVDYWTWTRVPDPADFVVD